MIPYVSAARHFPRGIKPRVARPPHNSPFFVYTTNCYGIQQLVIGGPRMRGANLPRILSGSGSIGNSLHGANGTRTRAVQVGPSSPRAEGNPSPRADPALRGVDRCARSPRSAGRGRGHRAVAIPARGLPRGPRPASTARRDARAGPLVAVFPRPGGDQPRRRGDRRPPLSRFLVAELSGTHGRPGSDPRRGARGHSLRDLGLGEPGRVRRAGGPPRAGIRPGAVPGLRGRGRLRERARHERLGARPSARPGGPDRPRRPGARQHPRRRRLSAPAAGRSRTATRTPSRASWRPCVPGSAGC